MNYYGKSDTKWRQNVINRLESSDKDPRFNHQREKTSQLNDYKNEADDYNLLKFKNSNHNTYNQQRISFAPLLSNLRSPFLDQDKQAQETSLGRYFNHQEGKRYSSKKGFYSQNHGKGLALNKLIAVSQKLSELVFFKQSISSLIREQSMKMGDFTRELKRHLFQLDIKMQKEESYSQLKLRKNGSSQLGVLMIHASSKTFFQGQEYTVDDLKTKCQQLIQQNIQMKSRYESMLIRYRQQIQKMSGMMMSRQNSIRDEDNWGQNRVDQIEEQIFQLKEQNYMLKRRVRQGEDKLKSQQQRFIDKIKRLEGAIVELQQQYLKQKQQFQKIQQRYKSREKDIDYRQSQVENKRLKTIQREKLLDERQLMMKQEKGILNRRDEKISQIQYNMVKRQREQKEYQKDRLRSDYFNNQKVGDQRYIMGGGDRFSEHNNNRFNSEKSQTRTVTRSRIDINSRLREIQAQRRGHGIKSSRMSQNSHHLPSQRSLSRQTKFNNRLTGKVGTICAKDPLPKQYVNVNQKLQNMIRSLNKDLNDIK